MSSSTRIAGRALFLALFLLAFAGHVTVTLAKGSSSDDSEEEYDDGDKYDDGRDRNDNNVYYNGAQNRDLSQTPTRLFLAHMIIMIIAWMGCFPLGMLIARYGRTRMTGWFPKHRAIQSFGFVLVFIAFFLAMAATYIIDGDHFDNAHTKLGLALCILLLLQCVLGAVAHVMRNKTGSRVVGYVHMPLGVLMLLLSVVTMHKGFDRWRWNAPRWPLYLLYAWLAVVMVVYAMGFLRIKRERAMDQEWRQRRFEAKKETDGQQHDIDSTNISNGLRNGRRAPHHADVEDALGRRPYGR